MYAAAQNCGEAPRLKLASRCFGMEGGDDHSWVRSERKARRRAERGDEAEEQRRERKRRKHEKRARRSDSGGGGAPQSADEDGWRDEADAAPARAPRRAFDDEDDADVPFVWGKRNTMLARAGVRLSAADEAARRAEAAVELERAKARREERQRERDAADAERAGEARLREQELNRGWDRAEVAFHGQQHFLRQAIRLREGRATLGDVCARNVRLDLLELLPERRSPCELVMGMMSGLTTAALRELYEAVQLELDYIPDFDSDDDTAVFNRALRLDWWKCMDTFVADLLAWAADDAGSAGGGIGGGGRKLTPDSGGAGDDGEFDEREQQQQRRARPRVHPSVQSDLEDMLAGKSRTELLSMEAEIAPRIEGGAARRRQQEEEGVDDDYADVEFWQAALGRIRRGAAEARIAELNDILAEERAAILAAMPAEEAGDGDKRAGIDSDAALREGPVDMGEEAMVQAEAAKGMREDEERFADLEESVLGGRTYAWNDKYRPRRPRFFNRVQTGYDWNKYNRTHYDHDNPPPKTVQGYKFNIFYPDLIDRSVAPTFNISRTDNPEVCILTFKSGPPYEDLAFKIVSRPWEHSHRRGFRCTFDRGVLQLWFNFRRLRYRR